MKEEESYPEEISTESIKITDLEEKQRILKNRVLLIGQNLIEMKEKTNENIIKIKKDLDGVKENLEKIKSFIENISREFPKFARKDDLDILTKQAKMFQPLEYLNNKNR